MSKKKKGKIKCWVLCQVVRFGDNIYEFLLQHTLSPYDLWVLLDLPSDFYGVEFKLDNFNLPLAVLNQLRPFKREDICK